MWDSKHRAVTQTIHTDLISWVCSLTQAIGKRDLFMLVITRV